jgi:hypothetical protein
LIYAGKISNALESVGPENFNNNVLQKSEFEKVLVYSLKGKNIQKYVLPLKVFGLIGAVTIILLYGIEVFDFFLLFLVPMKIYDNAVSDKTRIIKENKGKSGVYLFTNLINGKKYVGSAIDLPKRLNFYYSEQAMLNSLLKSNSHIYRAILKNGLSIFSLSILEYCESSKCIEREDYYMQLIEPSYNINPKAGSSLGFKHSPETLKKISDAQKGENNSMFNRTGEKNPMFDKSRPEGAGRASQKIEVVDLQEKTTTTYNSMHAAAKALDIRWESIKCYFARNQQKPYKGRYTFKKID